MTHSQSDFTFFFLYICSMFILFCEMSKWIHNFMMANSNLTDCRFFSFSFLNGDACRIWKINQVLIWLLWMWHVMPFRQFNSCFRLKKFEKNNEIKTSRKPKTISNQKLSSIQRKIDHCYPPCMCVSEFVSLRVPFHLSLLLQLWK